MDKKKVFNVPNTLTILRIIMIPFFSIAILDEKYILAVALFAAGTVSDVLDGYIARKKDLVTNFGKITDPIADKLMQFMAILTLTINGVLDPIIIIIITVKELLMGIGTIVLFKKKKIINSANWYGKLTTILIYCGIILLLFDVSFGEYLLYAALFTTVYSIAMYTVLAKRAIDKD